MTGVTFQINNTENVELVNDVDPLLVVVYKGTQADFNVPKPWPAWPEAPTVFIRPAPGSWCGGFMITRQGTNVKMYCAGAFEYVVCCSPTSWDPGVASTFGLETFDGNARMLFSTNRRFARITTILPIAGPVVTNRGEIIQGVAGMSGWTQMPWINIAMAGLTGAIVAGGGDLSYQESYLISVNGNFTQMRMTIGDTIAAGNYYAGRTVYFPLGFIAGN